MRFGKHPAKKSYRTPAFSKYVLSTIAPPPDAFDILPKVMSQTGIHDIGTLFPMDGNDELGCCTIAALAHAITVYDGMIGLRKIWSKDDVVKVYQKLTGGPDVGLNEYDVLTYWEGRFRDPILGHVDVDVHNLTSVKQAIEIFGSLYIGFQVQDTCMDEFNSGQVWTPGNYLTNDGHAVLLTGYDKVGPYALTWGAKQQGSWEWFLKCVDEAHCILPIQATKANFNPNYNLDQLKADLLEISS